MSERLVSVIIATYHRYSSLVNALDSISKQTYSNIEVILVSDNANEAWNCKVSSAVTAFFLSHPNIAIKRIVNERNMGSAETRNIGIYAANGEYITFLDDDDVYLPDKIKTQLAEMEKENADYGITDLFLYDEKEKLIDKRIRNYILCTDQKSLFTYHLKYHMTGTDTMMFRKEYLDKIGGFAPINIGDEFYLMERAINGNGKFCYCKGCAVKAYVHSETDGLSSGKTKIKGENELYAYKKSIWNTLDNQSKRYINMRHYAVLAFAYFRMKKRYLFLANAIKSFFSSPVACIELIFKRKMS